ncbi:MAG: aminoglycoside 6-adenylyltransferase [Gemmatimonadales bacterium]
MRQTEGTERILSKTVSWGAGRDDLRAIAVVGSHARSDHPADPWSDLDLIFMARQPKRYLDQADWVAEIETPWLAVLEPTVVGGERIFHITFAGGTKVDLVVVSSLAFSLAGRALATLRRHPSLLALLPSGIRFRLTTLSELLDRGFRFILDKDRIAARLRSGDLALAPRKPPSEDEFLHLVKRFLNEQLAFALKMRRGEFFVAKTQGESRLTDLLLRMIEWHTQVTSDRWSPVFERGRFLEEWAPPFVIERLSGTFASYDPAQIWRARLEALDLFRSLAEETAGRLGYVYPKQLEDTVMTWVRDQAAEAEGRRPGAE